MKKLMFYYRSAREEMLKVIFPTREQIRNALISVILVVSVITLFLALFDVILSATISGIILKS